MRIRLRATGDVIGQQVQLKLTVALGDDHGSDSFDVALDRCSSFTMTCSVERNEFNKLVADIEQQKLVTHLFILRRKFNAKECPATERAANMVRYLLANILYLQAWQVALSDASPFGDDARKFIEGRQARVTTIVDQLLQKDRRRLRQTLNDWHDRIQPLLDKRDVQQSCLYDHLRDFYLVSCLADDVQVQCILGLAYLSGVGGRAGDPVLARHFFEKAVLHQHAASQYTLGKMYELGQGDLPKNNDRAMALFQLAAQQGHVEAGSAKQMLALRIDTERQHEAARSELARIVAERQREEQRLEQLRLATVRQIDAQATERARLAVERQAEVLRTQQLRITHADQIAQHGVELARLAAERQAEVQRNEALRIAAAAQIDVQRADLAQLTAERRVEEARIDALRIAATHQVDQQRAELARIVTTRQIEEQRIEVLRLTTQRQAEQDRIDEEQARLAAEARRQRGALFRLRAMFQRTPAANQASRARRPAAS